MLLPYANRAIVNQSKITQYLLNLSHPDGKSKAFFFISLGYSCKKWRVLQRALQTHALQNKIKQTIKTEHGTRYIIEGPFQSLIEKKAFVRTVWIIDNNSAIPRLITAHPIKNYDKRT